MVLCPGTPVGSTSSGSGLESFRRWGYSLKSHLIDWWSRGENSGLLGKRQVSEVTLLCTTLAVGGKLNTKTK